MTRGHLHGLLLVFGVLSFGCGDALVDGAYRGRELFVVEGWVRLDGDSAGISVEPDADEPASDPKDDKARSGPLRVALFWAPAKGSGFRFEGAVEQDVATDGLFPARFRLALFAPPEAALVKPVADGFGDLAVAVVLAYLDDDQDQRWDRDSEQVVGGAPDSLLVYTPLGVGSRLYGTLGPGFHRLVPIQDCVARPDGSGFETRYAIDTSDVDLFVSLSFPVELFVDADCDGKSDEWTGVCPPLDGVRALCRSGQVLETQREITLCGTCGPLLSPDGAGADKCEGWFGSCLYSAPPEECEAERKVCLGQLPTDPGCVELDCVCLRVYDECLANTGDQVGCKGKYNDCIAR